MDIYELLVLIINFWNQYSKIFKPTKVLLAYPYQPIFWQSSVLVWNDFVQSLRRYLLSTWPWDLRTVKLTNLMESVRFLFSHMPCFFSWQKRRPALQKLGSWAEGSPTFQFSKLSPGKLPFWGKLSVFTLAFKRALVLLRCSFTNFLTH